jgi:hypothetical protein
MNKKSDKERIENLEKQIEFLKAVISKYLLTGNNQLDASFKDWEKKQGIFRSSQL